MGTTCPEKAFYVNGTCVCSPGLYLVERACVLYQPRGLDGRRAAEVSDYGFLPKFSASIYDNNNNSANQEPFVILTVVLLGIWLGGTLFLRTMPLRGIFFTLRRYVSLVDYAFSKKHWIDEQKVQVKRKTELGGMLSIGAFIFIIGITLGIVYSYVLNRQITVQNIVPTNGRDVQEFFNDLSFNITAVGSMKCSQLRSFEYLITGDSEITVRYSPLSDFANVTCLDTAQGPVVTTECPNCQIGSRDDYYNIFEFVDLPAEGLYAAAVGFEFSVKLIGTQGTKTRQSYVTGGVQAGSNGTSAAPSTLRGEESNVLEFRFIPRVFEQDDNLKLIQATFHSYTTGSLIQNSTELQESIATANGTVRLIIHTKVLSAYLVETTVTAQIGILTFLSRIGGIYQLGILLFFTTLNMSERWITFLRYDDKLLNRLEKQRLARYRWRKVRIAVKYGLLTGHFAQKANEQDSGGDSKEKVEMSSAIGRRRLFGSSFLSRRRHFSRDGVGISESMERKGRQDTQKTIPDLQEVKVEGGESAGTHSRTKATGQGGGLGANVVKFVPKGILQAPGPRNDSGGLTHVPEVPPPISKEAESLSQAAEVPGHGDQKKPKRKRPARDTRLGSTSEHKGSVIRKIRKPSWIPDYDMLPAVPDPWEEMKAAQKAAAKEKKTMEAEGEEAPLLGKEDSSDSDEDKVELEPIDVYNYMIDLYDYQNRLRRDFLAAQSMLENVVQRFRPHSDL